MQYFSFCRKLMPSFPPLPSWAPTWQIIFQVIRTALVLKPQKRRHRAGRNDRRRLPWTLGLGRFSPLPPICVLSLSAGSLKWWSRPLLVWIAPTKPFKVESPIDGPKNWRVRILNLFAVEKLWVLPGRNCAVVARSADPRSSGRSARLSQQLQTVNALHTWFFAWYNLTLSHKLDFSER